MVGPIEYRAYSTVTGAFDYFTIKDLLTNVNRPISEKAFNEDLSIEQFTGLLNSIGVKIFVGDVYSVDGYGICEVILDPYFGACFVRSGKGQMTISDVIQLNLDYLHIGNIHQNPIR